MTQAVLYLATAPKSNTALTTFAAAREAVRERGALPVPSHIRDAHTKFARSMGHGAGYQYPHDFDGHFVPDDYLPEALSGQRFFVPSTSGYEKTIGERVAFWRAAVEKNRKREG